METLNELDLKIAMTGQMTVLDVHLIVLVKVLDSNVIFKKMLFILQVFVSRSVETD